MRRKVFAAILGLAMTALVVAASFNYRAGDAVAATRAAASASELLGMLPAADAVGYVDAQRTLSEIIPHIFAGDSETLARINRDLDEFRQHTGTDARQFDAIAVAARFKKGSLSTDYVVGLVRGRFNASEAIATGLAKSRAEAEAGKRRVPQWKEVQYDGVTIYTENQTGGFCLAAVDANTVVFGDLGGIKALLDAKAGRAPRADSSLTELATLNPSAVAGFAANVPAEGVRMVAGNEEWGTALESVRQVYGSADASGTNGTLSVALRSESNEQAQALAEKLSSLKQLAALYLSNARVQGKDALPANVSPEDVAQAQAAVNGLPISRWVRDVTIAAEGSDVKLRLEEPLTDMAIIFRR